MTRSGHVPALQNINTRQVIVLAMTTNVLLETSFGFVLASVVAPHPKLVNFSVCLGER